MVRNTIYLHNSHFQRNCNFCSDVQLESETRGETAKTIILISSKKIILQKKQPLSPLSPIFIQPHFVY